MTSYYDMSRDQAVAALEEFLEERAPALERLEWAIVEDGVEVATVLDGTPESLTPLWRWTKSRLARVPAAERLDDPARMPTWLRYTTGRESTLTEDSLALVDGVLSYFCQVVERHVPQAEWRLVTTGTRPTSCRTIRSCGVVRTRWVRRISWHRLRDDTSRASRTRRTTTSPGQRAT
jgi:hypothetical protein